MIVEYVGLFTAGALAGGLVWERYRVAHNKKVVAAAQLKKRATAAKAAEKRKAKSMAKLEKANALASSKAAGAQQPETEAAMYGRKSNGEASWGT